jgi:STE24 endopeptidase
MMPAMKIFVLSTWLLTVAIGLGLRALNLRHLRRHGATVPAGFEGEIDPERLRQAAAYTAAQSRTGLIETLFDDGVVLVFFFGGLLPLYDRWIGGLTGSFIGAGVLFALGLLLVQTVLGIPFDLCRTFRLEARFGFNTTTGNLWLADLGKSLAISLVLLGLLGAAGLWLVQASPAWWWLWVWLLFALVTLVLLVISPYLIEPLFFKFEPLKREGLEEQVRALMGKAGLQVSRVMQVDASRRSRHSNAYFTGIGRVKRIVLFDTLLEQMSDREVLAILAHEVGHWKKGHLSKRLLWTQLISLGGFWLAHRLLTAGVLPGLLGLEQLSFYAQLLILGFVAGMVSFPLGPLSAWISRRHEGQADRFACDLSGDPAALASGLIKLSRENLSNLHPHPLYAWFYYSHPPLVERVRQLRVQR